MRLGVLFVVYELLMSLSSVNAEVSLNTTIESIWEDFKNAVDCGSCQVLFAGLKFVSGFGESFLVDVLTGLCDISKVEDSDVCEGVIKKEGPALQNTFRNLHIGSPSTQTLCASLIGLCQYPKVHNDVLSFPSPKRRAVRPSPSGKPPIKVAHFSDTHIDLYYQPGSSYKCSKPICCRVFEDQYAPGITKTPCGPFGNPKCDPPPELQESMNAAIAEINPEFSIYTGDVVAHDVWLVNKAEALESFDRTYGEMEKALGVVYAAIGNHDTAPLNLFSSDIGPDAKNQWAYNALAKGWFSLTGIPSVQSADEYGSYSAIHPNSNLRIISYNSIFYYKFNFYMYQEPMEKDPNGQFAWLIKELQAAEDAGQRAWLISHIPSGIPDHFHDYSQYFDQIVQRYESTIAGLFYGHTHMDEFQIAYSNYTNRTHDTASAMGYIAPAMTPTEGCPSFRVYEIDPDTFGVLDYTQYVANMSDPTYQKKPEWRPYYSAKADYGSKLSPPITDPKAELTPAFWHNVTVAMERDASSIFQEFWARRFRGYNVTDCDNECVKSKICALRAADAQFNCFTPKPGFSLSRRDGEAALLEEKEHPCDHGGLATLLGRIASRARVVRQMEA